MKNLLLALISFSLFLSCNDNGTSILKEENDWKKLNLKGSVKLFREMKFLAVDDFATIANGKKVEYIYNEEILFNLDGNKIEKNSYVPDGTLANRTVYLYKKNQLAEYNNYDSQGVLFGTGKYEANEIGQIIKLKYIGNDGHYSWVETYEYDSKGNLTEVKRFTTDDKVVDTKETYTFDDNGYVKESELHKDNELVSKNNYQYDSEGNYSKLNFGDSITYAYKYDYDTKGNWIKKIIFENDNPSGILVREFEYFN